MWWSALELAWQGNRHGIDREPIDHCCIRGNTNVNALSLDGWPGVRDLVEEGIQRDV